MGFGATLAGEALHFRSVSPSMQEAMAAAPLDAGASLDLPLVVLRWGGAVDTLRVTIPVGPGEYRMEKLTVAPRFGTTPDSATAARLASERERAMRVSRRSHATPRMWGDTVIRPRDSRITSGFGDGREFNGQVQSRHTGMDFAGGIGAPVVAAARGVVALVDSFYLAGNVIYIDHGQGLVTAYFHLSRQDVAEGDTVEAGQVIGLVGDTGRVTGPHLHWVVRYGRISVDPLSLLALTHTSGGS
jgi:murein DD-endopeptidase MepM/ murein hydrolase activator NlpD